MKRRMKEKESKNGRLCLEMRINSWKKGIRCFFCIGVLTAAMFCYSGQAFAATQITINTGTLNVRSDAGTGFAKVGSVSQGEIFTVLQEKDGWYKIVLPNGVAGWVIKDYVLAQNDIYPEKVTVDSGLVNIRSGPDTSYDKIGELTKGISLQVLGRRDDWYQVYLQDGKTVGWVASWVVKAVSSNTTTGENPGNTGNTGTGEPASPSENKDVRQGKVNTTSLNVRKTPSDSGTKITSLPAGTVVNILSEKGTILDSNNCWYEISTDSIASGWVRSSYISVMGAENSVYTPAKTDTLWWDEGNSVPGTGKITTNSASYGLLLQVTANGQIHYKTENISNGMIIYTDAALTGNLSNDSQKGVTLSWYDDLHTALKITWDSKQYVSVALQEDGKGLEIKIGSSSLIGKFIVVDPGHGTYTSASGSGMDSGAVGTGGLHEQIATLEMGKKTKTYLEERGATVVLTRTGGTYLTLAERAWMANALKSDVFVSIHCNSSTNKSANGSGTYFYAPVGNSNYDRAERQRLAQCMQNAIIASAGRSNYGVREDNFAVIRETMMPSVLIETAFISNLEEELLLASDDFRSKMAYGIANGLENYFAQ